MDTATQTPLPSENIMKDIPTYNTSKPTKQMRHRWFSLIILTIACCTYIRALIRGYVFIDLGDWMIATGILYLLMHYVTLSWYEYAHTYKGLWILFILIVTGIITFKTQSIWLGASVLARNIAVSSALHTLKGSLESRVTFNPLVFFRAGDAIFSTFFVISFVTAFIGRNHEFTLTCDDITKASTRVITYTQEKFDFGKQEIQQYANNFITSMVGEKTSSEIAQNTALVQQLTQITNTLDTESTTGYSNTGQLYQHLLMQFSGSISGTNIPRSTTYPSSIASGADSTTGLDVSQGLMGTISQLVHDTMSNQKQVTRQTCEVVIAQIKNLYTKPGFVVSVLLSLFILLLPVLRISLYVISAINVGIFMILKKLGVYKISKKTSIIDIVE